MDALNDDADTGKAIIASTTPNKVNIPPITIFNLNRLQLVKYLTKNVVLSYSLKNLRHAVHLYCTSVEDCKKVRFRIDSEKINGYTHDLKEERLFKMALKGLHQMDTKDLTAELQSLSLSPSDIWMITPRNPRFASDVVYIVSFK